MDENVLRGVIVMALVKCPECGRENVSDSAEACPDCGYGLKAHFEKIRKEEERKEQEEQRIRKRQEEIKKIEMPIKPNAKTTYILAFVMFGSWGLLCLILPSPFNILGLILFESMAIWQGSLQHNKEVEKYNRAMADFEKYQQDEYNRIKQEEAMKQYQESTAIRCPMCRSTNVAKIDTFDRAVSVGIVGLASGKIGKQYKCKNCKHMW